MQKIYKFWLNFYNNHTKVIIHIHTYTIFWTISTTFLEQYLNKFAEFSKFYCNMVVTEKKSVKKFLKLLHTYEGVTKTICQIQPPVQFIKPELSLTLPTTNADVGHTEGLTIWINSGNISLQRRHIMGKKSILLQSGDLDTSRGFLLCNPVQDT